MSDRPDFTTNTALNAVADAVDTLPVSINAQTLGSLAVDIAAQSAGDIDINLNTASDTVTVELGSSAVTLDVNITGSNTTLDTNISGSSTTFDTDITSQSVGSLSTAIDGQTGDVGISFNSQTGNVDINFADQTGGVETGAEFAARNGDTVTRRKNSFLQGNSNTGATLFTNTTSNTVLLETLTMSIYNAYSDDSRAQFTVNTSSSSVSDISLSLVPVTSPFEFTPAVPIENGGSIDLVLENNSNNSAVVEAVAVLRRL